MAVQGTYVHLGQRLYLNPADVSRSLRSPADGPPAGAAARWGKQVGVPPSVWAIILLAPTNQLPSATTAGVNTRSA